MTRPVDADSPAARTSNEAPRVSFVIPVRDDAARLRRCLATIASNQYPRDRVEVIVADNGSSDGSDEVARDAGALVLILPELRVGELRNRAAEAATGDILAFVDSDHEIDPRWVLSAVETLQSPGVAAVGALYHAPANGTWVQRAYDALRQRQPGCHEVEWLGSGNLAVWRDIFKRLGGFDTTLETCEDVALCQRLRASGHRVMSDDRLRSVHLGDPPTLGSLFLSELWRGRDNLRVSLRGPISLRGLPSVVVPVVDLGLIALGFAGLLAAPFGGLMLTVMAGGGILGLASLRAVRMVVSRGLTRPLDAAQAFVVAFMYDVARALALVVRGTHQSRRTASAA